MLGRIDRRGSIVMLKGNKRRWRSTTLDGDMIHNLKRVSFSPTY
jgi:hypothetical protein